MTNEEIWISILTGLLINIIVAIATYYITSRRDKATFESQTERQNEQIAEIAINHLSSSYTAIKKLRTDVLSHMQSARSQSSQFYVATSDMKQPRVRAP